MLFSSLLNKSVGLAIAAAWDVKSPLFHEKQAALSMINAIMFNRREAVANGSDPVQFDVELELAVEEYEKKYCC